MGFFASRPRKRMLATISTIERQTRERLKFEINAAASQKARTEKKRYPYYGLGCNSACGLAVALSAGMRGIGKLVGQESGDHCVTRRRWDVHRARSNPVEDWVRCGTRGRMSM